MTSNEKSSRHETPNAKPIPHETSNGRSSLHEWINSIGLIITAVFAIVSAYYSRNEALLREDDVVFSSIPTVACGVEYFKIGDGGELGLCWDVTISNRSDLKVSLVSERIIALVNGSSAIFGGFHELMNANGSPLSLPVTLDGGDSKSIIVRAPVSIPASAAKAIESVEKSGIALPTISLAQLQDRLVEARMDFLGDSIDVISVDGKVQGWSLKPPFQSAVSVLEMQTGRGKWFVGDLVWPPRPQN
jgi:hypothetical protein